MAKNPDSMSRGSWGQQTAQAATAQDMKDTYEQLAARALALLQRSGQRRAIVVLVGPPGSGKSTIAEQVCALINEMVSRGAVPAGDGDADQETEEEAAEKELERFLGSIPTSETADQDIESAEYRPYRAVDAGVGRTEVFGRGGRDTRITVETLSSSASVGAAAAAAAAARGEFAKTVPMDGFHLTRQQLAQFRDPAQAIARRGSPATFDDVNLVNLCTVLQLSRTSRRTVVKIPSFSHALKDPVPDAITIAPESRILILEGLYFLLKDRNFCGIHETLGHVAGSDAASDTASDGIEYWMVNIDPSVNSERVARRHVQSGIVADLEEGIRQHWTNDAKNGEYLLANSFPCDLQIDSVTDVQLSGLAPQELQIHDS